MAELQETLRQTEEAVQAVQGERDELKEGVGRMRDELLSLRKSNSLLATQKQQWSVMLCLASHVIHAQCHLTVL